MTSLYDLGNATQSLVDDVTLLLEQGADPNSDEVQSLLKQMVESEDNWDKKAINVAKYLQHIQQQKEIIKLESDRLAKKIKALDSQYSNLHDLLLYQMQGFGKTDDAQGLIFRSREAYFRGHDFPVQAVLAFLALAAVAKFSSDGLCPSIRLLQIK